MRFGIHTLRTNSPLVSASVNGVHACTAKFFPSQISGNLCVHFPSTTVIRIKMDLKSVKALLLTAKDGNDDASKVRQLLLQQHKADTLDFMNTYKPFHRDVQRFQRPLTRCVRKRGRGRCRGSVSGIAIYQFCPYHQYQQCGDINVEVAKECIRDNAWLEYIMRVKYKS